MAEETVQTEEPTAQASDNEESIARPAEREPDSRRVRIRRRLLSLPKLDSDGNEVLDDKGNPVLVERSHPVTRIPYEHEGKVRFEPIDVTEDTFEFSALIAHAAIATGFFEEDPSSKTKLR